MPTFTYTARDAHGTETTGRVDAGSRKAALAQLAARQLTPSQLAEAGAAASSPGGGLVEFVTGSEGGRRRFGREHALPFLRALMGLVTAGIQVADGVRLLSKRLSNPALRALAVALWDQLSQGRSLSQAMAAHPRVFDEASVNLVQAGEATGRLGGVLERLVADLEERKEIRSRLIAAMTYPVILVITAFGVVLVLLLFLLPRIEALLASLHGKLPLSTRLLIGLGDFGLHYGWFFALVAVTAGVIFWAWRRKPEGRRITDGWLVRTTGIGAFVVNSEILRLTQALALLLENGITTMSALAMTERTLQNLVFRAAFAEARGKIAEGAGIATALRGTGYFPDLVIDVLTVGENTGNIVPSLKEVARMHRQRLARDSAIFVNVLSYGALLAAFALVALVAIGIISAVFAVSSSLKAG